MARIKNFWDLENITSYSSHMVDQFDTNTPNTGGGHFKWIAQNNTAITNIAGIRIKPLGTTDGYWQRDYEGAVKIDWFGPAHNSTLMSALGVSQATANARYGAGLVNVTLDTYDTAAIKFAFKLMETVGYQAVDFAPKNYYISRALELPVTTGLIISIFKIKGNGAVLNSTVGHTANFFNRVPPNQTAALGIYVAARFFIDGFLFRGNGTAGQTAIRLGPSFSSHLCDIEFRGSPIGINLEFCLHCRLTNVMGAATQYGFKADYGSAWGGNNSNSQSNHTQFVQCRVYNEVGMNTSFYIRGSSGCSLKDCIVEGESPIYGVWFDYDGSTVVKDFTVENTHIETTCTGSAIYIRSSNGSYHVDKVFNQYPQNLIEFDCPTGYPQIKVSNISFTHALTTFANKNAGAIWKFEDCELGPAPWMTGPSPIHPYISTAWKTGAGYFQPTGKYSAAHAPQGNHRCYVIDPIINQLTND